MESIVACTSRTVLRYEAKNQNEKYWYFKAVNICAKVINYSGYEILFKKHFQKLKNKYDNNVEFKFKRKTI